MMSAGEGMMGLFGMVVFMLVYLAPIVLVIWAIVNVVRALNRVAAAQESATRTLEQIAGYLARKV
jgi:uncharacterized membrane protein